MDANKRKILVLLFSLSMVGVFYCLRAQLFAFYLSGAENDYRQQRNEKVLADFLFAGELEEKGGNDTARISRARVFYEAGEFERARQELLGEVNGGSKNFAIYELLGKIEQTAGNFSLADGYFAKASALNPSNEIKIEQVKNLIRSGEKQQAETLLAGMDAGSAGEDNIYYLGLIRFDETGAFPAEFAKIKAGSHKDAIRSVQAFCSRSEANANPDYDLILKADLFNKINETDFAYADIFTVLKSNDNYADAWLTLGKTQLIEGDLPKAQAAFERCLSLDVDNPEAFFWLSGIYEKTGDSRKAEEYKMKYDALVK